MEKQTEEKSSLLHLNTEGWNITLQWVPTHSGVQGSEVDDATAKMALSEINITLYFVEFRFPWAQLRWTSAALLLLCSIGLPELLVELGYPGVKDTGTVANHLSS